MLYSKEEMQMGNPPHLADFWRKILPEIKVPVYAIDQFTNNVEELTPEDLRWLLS